MPEGWVVIVLNVTDLHAVSSQVHALNILRALYRDTRLGENIVPFVSDGMQAAVLGFTSPVWAVSVHVLHLSTFVPGQGDVSNLVM